MPSFVWLLHFVFWWPFLLRGQVQRMQNKGAHLGEAVKKHPLSIPLIAAHTVAAAFMYGGQWWGERDIGGDMPPNLGPGLALVLLGAALARWTLHRFTSWRLRAEITEDHVLTTTGPFALVRHPIYLAMNLLAAGTAVWFPNPATLVGLVGMVVVGDLRGRAEEQLLIDGFGDEYRAYMKRVKRTIPLVY